MFLKMQLLSIVFGLICTSFTWAINTHDLYLQGEATQYTLSYPTNGNCNLMAFPADAETMYAAASPLKFNHTINCGRCARVSCAEPDLCKGASSKSEIVYIVDQCPGCLDSDLDLSPRAFQAITGHQNDRIPIQWQFVDCPIDSSVQYCLKNGSNAFWTAIQPTNVVSGVSSMKVNGKPTKMVDSAFYFVLDGDSQVETNLKALDIELQNQNGEVLKETIDLSNGGCVHGVAQFKKGAPSSGKDYSEKSNSDNPKSSTPSNNKKTEEPTNNKKTEEPSITNTIPPSSTPPEPTATTVSVMNPEVLEETKVPSAPTQQSISNNDQSYIKTPASMVANTPRQANTKTQKDSYSVSPSIIALFVLVVIGVIAFTVLAIIVKRKKLQDKQLDALESQISNEPSLVVYDEVVTPTNQPDSFTLAHV